MRAASGEVDLADGTLMIGLPNATDYVEPETLKFYESRGEVAEEERHRAFNRQPLRKRVAVVVAGPLFNFLFAIFAYWLTFIIGIGGLKPVIGEVEPDGAAAAAGRGSRSWPS